MKLTLLPYAGPPTGAAFTLLVCWLCGTDWTTSWTAAAIGMACGLAFVLAARWFAR